MGGLKKFHEKGRKFFFSFFFKPNMNASFYFLMFEKNCNFVCRLIFATIKMLEGYTYIWMKSQLPL